MTTDAVPVPDHLEAFALREFLVDALGWSPVSAPPVRITVGGTAVILRPLAERDGRIALEYEAPIDGSIPAYALRRAIRAEAGRVHPDPLIVFRDVLRTAQVWQWTEHRAGRVAIYREHTYLPDGPDPLLVRKLAVLRTGSGAAQLRSYDAAPALGSDNEALRTAVADRLLPALLRRVRRRCPAPFRPGGTIEQRLGEATDLRPVVQEIIADSDRLALPRAFWRALGKLAVLDPACGEGDRLLAVLEVLEPLYDACLERMGSWVADLDRSRTTHRPEKLADFRAALDRAHDERRYPARHDFIIVRILRDNLHGVDPRPDRVGTCRRRLLGELATDPACLTELDLNLHVGDAGYGFATLAEIRRAMAEAPDAAARVQRLQEEAETAARAVRLLRRMRVADGSGTPAEPGGGTRILERRSTLRDELDALLARQRGIAPGEWRTWREQHRPFHLWMEFGGILARGGFDVVLDARTTERVSESRAVFGSLSPTDLEESTPMDTRADECTRLDPRRPGHLAELIHYLGDETPELLTARGGIEILRHPLLAVFCSIRVPGDLILRTLDLARELRDANIVTISGFQSPVERECLTFLLRGSQPIIVSPARGIAAMRLPAAWRDPFDEGRLLVLSGFPEKIRRPTTRMTEARNRMVGALARSIFIAHAAPGGRTYRLARELIGWGKPVFTLDDPANRDLLLLGARPAPRRVAEMLELPPSSEVRGAAR